MRLVRHLTFSNVIALIALFIALGGAAYAGSKLNGKSIVNGSIGGGKLKNETITAGKIKKGTITGAQIKEGSITSTAINVSTLPTVPSATTASTAQIAEKATNATSATNAGKAESADSAKHADEADSATHADSATEAAHATTADDADTIEGESGVELRAELTVGCSTTTEFYGGMCWDKTTRPPAPWLTAIEECAADGGRLPTIGELIAFILKPGEQVAAQVWSGDLADVVGPAEDVLTSDEHGRNKREGAGFELGYRCVFPQSN